MLVTNIPSPSILGKSGSIPQQKDSHALQAPEIFDDPSNLFRDLEVLRESDNIEFNEHLKAYVVTRYNDIVQILDNPETFSSQPTVPVPPDFMVSRLQSKCPLRGTLLGLDNPDHDRLRRSVASFFVPRRLKRFQPLMESFANQLIDDFIEDDQVEIKSSFALPLPLKIISAIAGLDPERWQWVGQSLALFGGHADMNVGTLEDKIQGIIALHEHIADLIQQRKRDRRDDLISHIWNERDSGNVTMTDFEHLSMIPGLLLAGHETTTNLLSMGLSHLLHNNLWTIATENDQSTEAAIEELVRYESAITGMKRLVTRPVQIGNICFQPGDVLFAAYNAGSRDPAQFTHPSSVSVGQQGKSQHLGFGRGIHACLGAPLARLLLRVEMQTLAKRLPGLRLVTPYEDRIYHPVSEGRGIDRLLLSWDSQAVSKPDKAEPLIAYVPSHTLKDEVISTSVEDIVKVAQNVIQITFSPLPESKLPTWSPGAHIDVPVGEKGFRQYSLCSGPRDRARWRIAVLKEHKGQGGSEFIHRTFQKGQRIDLRGPRNHFALRKSDKYIFIAGGIGITPIRAMIEEVEAQESEYQLLYLGNERQNMAYVDELSRNPRASVWVKSTQGPCDLGHFFAGRDFTGSLVYCCGPERLMVAVERLFSNHLPSSAIHVERFSNNFASSHKPNQPFDIVLARSNRTLRVPENQSILQVLHENGVPLMSTCTKGTCGTCEVSVIDGVPEHRDTVLTHEEKAANRSLMTCVSRCKGKQLTLDLW
ncbi:hypothetical protein PFICI_08736 [Pestalotiopsis fici W106-1]|uniref:Cytochrome P450 n=1 Tax=Pestalotiopsis fici (strain W106-1 / CGMCC3.15140) TaxID=1229662 RepID=W3WYD0_PESFW|nr:uncharacterized protein PFICI_08736 [Pestalotiopsis fici W106-1]ETS78883.1 hypothetical protein PFICI_08736 [Pestalotiopsis fici W106-1]